MWIVVLILVWAWWSSRGGGSLLDGLSAATAGDRRPVDTTLAPLAPGAAAGVATDTAIPLQTVVLPGADPSPSFGTILQGGDILRPDDFRLSPSGGFGLHFQADGNLVLVDQRGAWVPIWASGTDAVGGYATMQTDGNFVVYRNGGIAAWSTGTAGNPGADLRLTDNGALSVMAGSRILWSTNLRAMLDQLGQPGIVSAIGSPKAGSPGAVLSLYDVTLGSFGGGGSPGRSVGHRRGVVRARGPMFVDDDGEFYPFGASLFVVPWAYKYAPTALADALDFWRGKVDHVRIFGEVGGSSWEDRMIDPAWSDYRDVITGSIAECRARGLRIQPTIIAGGTGRNYDQLIDTWAEIITANRADILFAEVTNEDQAHVDDDQLMVWTRRLASTGVLACPTNRGADETQRLLDAGATCFTAHTDRGSGLGTWRQVRQPWDYKGLNAPGCNNEPPGPQSSVQENTDPLQLGLLRANGELNSLSGFVLHTGPGVRLGGKADLDRGRYARFQDVPNLDGIIAAIQSAGGILPAGVAGWGHANTQWGDNPLTLPDAQIGIDDGIGPGLMRGYCAYTDREFYYLALAVQNYADLIDRWDAKLTVYNPVDGSVIASQHVAASQAMRVHPQSGTPDGLGGYIIHGER